MIVAPTMRVPMVLADSVNAYLAARAAFLLVKHHRFQSGPDHGRPIGEKIGRLAFPGLGTGVGQLGPNTCAKQMRAAIDDVLLDRYTPPRSWADAGERHQLLYTDHPRRCIGETNLRPSQAPVERPAFNRASEQQLFTTVGETVSCPYEDYRLLQRPNSFTGGWTTSNRGGRST
jgi:hypothetical protein